MRAIVRLVRDAMTSRLDLAATKQLLMTGLAQAPVDTSDPLHDPEAANTQWIFSAKPTYAFDIRTGVVGGALPLPTVVQVAEDSFVTVTGAGTTAPLARIWGRRNTLYTVDLVTNLLVDSVTVPVFVVSSLAAQGSHLTMIADGHGYSVDGLPSIPRPQRRARAGGVGFVGGGWSSLAGSASPPQGIAVKHPDSPAGGAGCAGPAIVVLKAELRVDS